MLRDRMTYYLALVTLLAIPATLVSWICIHGLLSHWRRIGVKRAIISVSVITILTMASMYLIHKPLLQMQFTFRWPFAVAAIILFGISTYLNIRVYQEAPKTMALGLGELSGDRPEQLVTTGIYARIRHPRFSAMVLAVTSMALITGYLALYILIGIYVIGIYFIAVLEDRELMERFGTDYYEYTKRVPGFFPNIWNRRAK
jgi:protein-S-isoprenylcysteine O-methyltransferase Ste14